MKPEVITFDCAQTLIEVDWRPAALAVECLSELAIDHDSSLAAGHYDRILRSRWGRFQELSLQRNEAVLDEFWRELTLDWLTEADLSAELLDPVLEVAREKLFGPNSTVFKLYDDVVPCLEQLKSAGQRMAIISNWDNSLHRAVEMFDLTKYFELVIASLEEGVEKPDPRLFEITFERLGVEAGQVLHVGDNPIDDWQGAKNAGCQALVIDRENPQPSDFRLRSLSELPKRLEV